MKPHEFPLPLAVVISRALGRGEPGSGKVQGLPLNALGEDKQLYCRV